MLTQLTERESLDKAWEMRDKAAVKKIDNLLAAAGMSIDAVMAQTLSINPMISSASIE